MKKIVLLLLSACLVGLTTGCEKDLDLTPISNGAVPDFYKTPVDFDQALTAIYSQLSRTGTANAYPDRILTVSEIRSDNIYGVSSLGVRDWDPINNFATTLAVSPYMSDVWSQDYNAIFRANTMLEQLEKNGALLGVVLRRRYEAEARFLRAFHYFDLVRTFGKVPIIDRTLSPDEVAKIPRSPVADVYGLILTDLTTAKDILPVVYTGANIGRATAGAAKGLLALVYLTRSGPTYGIEGPGLGLSEYDKAYALCNEVIASATAAKYSFVANYASIWANNNENNGEVVFDVQYITGNGASYPGLMVPDGYFGSLGISIASGGVELKPISQDLYAKSFAPNDTRRAFSIANGYTTGSGTSLFTETRPVLKKYIDAAFKPAVRTDWALNFIVMRYTDILMMKAEAILRGGGGTPAEALAIVNQVRARGAQPALTSITYPQLIEERRREFVGEGLRWHDLVRSGLVLTTMNAWIPVEDNTASPKIRRNITANDIVYPVPQAELGAAPGLYQQNPGY